jgi:hypothetical protein
VEEKNDYAEWARRSAAGERNWFPRLSRDLEKDRLKGTFPRSLKDYEGRYINEPKTLVIDIKVRDKKLYFTLQEIEEETYALFHYHHDMFTWLVPRDEFAKRGRFTNQGAVFYKMWFGSSKDDKIDHLRWSHDKAVPSGELFVKE